MLLVLAVFLVPLFATAADTAFLLVDDRRGTVRSEGDLTRRLSPCSTFKIPNSLIALETKVASDAGFPLAYDPSRDGEQHGAWSRDQDLRSALANSTVWYFRELARRIGPERMQQFLERFDYGNRDASGGIDRFWLGSSLRISAEEQVAFLRRFREARLGISERSRSVVRDMLLLEASPRYRWYGKTGLCTDPDHGPVAWHAGFIEGMASTAYYAMNLTGGTLDVLQKERLPALRARLVSAGWLDATPPSASEQMRTLVEEAIAHFPGAVSFFAKNLDTGQEYGIRSDERVRTASTIKLPVMAAVFAAIGQGKARWDETLEMKAADKVSGSGGIRELADGTRLTIRDLVRLMIVVSDNTATNLLLDRFGGDFVNAEMDRLGLRQTRSLRKILGDGTNLKPVASGHSKEGLLPEFRRFGIGVSTPREMVGLLEHLERRRLASDGAAVEMLDILKRQQYKEGIGRQFPDEQVASKSGALDRLRSDVGIVFSEGGRIALAITVDDMLRTDYSPDNAANLLISDLAQKIVAGLSVPVSDLGTPVRTLDLQAPMDHVQGIDISGGRLWVSWVDRAKRSGHLSEFDLESGRLLRTTVVSHGARYHPGGIAADGDSVWVPVAEYRPDGTTRIQQRRISDLKVERQFEVPDHIGCIAVAGNRLYGGNWDARTIYTWDLEGRQIAAQKNPGGTAYQDLKYACGNLVGAGLRGRSSGAIDWLRPGDLSLLRRLRAGKTSRGVTYTHEGMAIAGGKLYLLPEDSPSRLFVFELPR